MSRRRIGWSGFGLAIVVDRDSLVVLTFLTGKGSYCPVLLFDLTLQAVG